MGMKNGLLRLFPSILIAFGIGLGLFFALMQPPTADLVVMTRLMAIASIISILAAYGTYRLGLVFWLPEIRLTFVVGTALASAILFFTIWIIARLMFANQHDFYLATVLLVFATGITMSVAFFLSESITARIHALSEAARMIADGKLGLRVPEEGRDELAILARAFNDMASNLESARQKQEELDASRRDLIAWISHDLRTPLTSIRAMLEALGDNMIDDPTTEERYLKTVQHEIRGLSQLIDDLFTVSQMDAGGLTLDCQFNSLGDLISDTIEGFSELAVRQKVTLEGSVNADVDPVWMDTRQLGRVLDNLVSNALHYTPGGGRISISAQRQDGEILVMVKDSGEGIRPEDLPHIFDRFYRGEKSRSRGTGGAGLGLAIASSVIEAHGGKIWVESRSGEGTCFSFSLPNTPQQKCGKTAPS
jgi:signal transduction histidine kinase